MKNASRWILIVFFGLVIFMLCQVHNDCRRQKDILVHIQGQLDSIENAVDYLWRECR